jgi:hypothetical protein
MDFLSGEETGMNHEDKTTRSSERKGEMFRRDFYGFFGVDVGACKSVFWVFKPGVAREDTLHPRLGIGSGF